MVEIESFIMKYDVQDSYEFMVKQLKSHKLKTDAQNWFNGEGASRFKELDGMAWADLAVKRIQEFKSSVDYRTKVGTDMVTDVDTFVEEYNRRKRGESFKVWKSAYHSMPDYHSGNMYAWFGRSGRGKSVLTSCVEACFSAMQGATVLLWTMEQSKYEILARMIAYIKASELQKEHEKDLSLFHIGDMLTGNINENEDEFIDFLKNLNSKIEGKIIIRAVDDEDFTKRSCDQLQADIIATVADVVFVDPIYYMDMEPNTSKTAGGDIANTSKRLRRLCGSTNTVLHVITQADEVLDDTDEDGKREIRVPKRAEVKKTKAILEDSTNLFGIDTCDGKFRIEIGKGRNGGEGTAINGIFLPASGQVYEPKISNLMKEVAEFGF